MEQISESELRTWRTLSWSAVFILLGIGSWWMFCLPTVGKGGLFLAAGAVLMPLFWDRIGIIGRMSWIAMLFLLLAVEYRAIDKEHHDNDLAQQKALKAIGDAFTGVLTDQRNSFADLIQKSDAAFKRTTEQASAQFGATMTKAQENLNHMTGGKTYPAISPVPIPLKNTASTFRLVIRAVGDSPLFDVNVDLSKLPLPTTASATDYLTDMALPYITALYTSASLSPNRGELLAPTVTTSENGQTDFAITTIARNGVFHERLHIRRVRDTAVSSGKDLLLPWEYSYEITRDVQRGKRTHAVSVTKIPWQKCVFANGQIKQQQEP